MEETPYMDDKKTPGPCVCNRDFQKCRCKILFLTEVLGTVSVTLV